MSTPTNTTPAGSASKSLASSTAFKTFAIVFGFSAAALYVVCDMMGWPLFSYHPATDRVELTERAREFLHRSGYVDARRHRARRARHVPAGTRHPENPAGAGLDRPGPCNSTAIIFADAVLDEVAVTGRRVGLGTWVKLT